MTLLPFYNKKFTTKLTPSQFKVNLWRFTVDWNYMPVHGIDYTYTFFKKIDFDNVTPSYVEAIIQEDNFKLRIQQPFYWKQILSIQFIGRFKLDKDSEHTEIQVYVQPNFFFIALSILTLVILILTSNSLLYMFIPIVIYLIIFNLEIGKLNKCLKKALTDNRQKLTQKP